MSDKMSDRSSDRSSDRMSDRLSDDNSDLLPKYKTPDFTIEERRLLIELVNEHAKFLKGKALTVKARKQRWKAWETVHKKFEANTDIVRVPRTIKQLKRCWDNMRWKGGGKTAEQIMEKYELKYNLRNERMRQVEESEPKPKGEDPLKLARKAKERTCGLPGLDENFLKIKEALNNSDCAHCTCEKIEVNAKVELMASQKQLNAELHKLELQLVREKLLNQRELHTLQVHELSLKIENERRRAEILDKKLGKDQTTC